MFDTFERVADPKERKELQCNDCKRSTIHTLEAQCTGKWSLEHVFGSTHFSLYRCGACDDVCFERSRWDSESYTHDADGQIEPLTEDVQYPPPSSSAFTFKTDHTPKGLDELLDEMLYALVGGKLNLATVGLRMVVEYIVNDRKCTGRNLQKKLDDLLAKEIVDQEQLDLLHKIRRRGNAGAHDGIAMTKREMVAGMGIIDLLIEKLYNGPGRHADVMKKAAQAFKD